MITKDEINSIIEINGVVFVNDLVNKFDTDDFIEIIDELHKIGINNQKIKVKVYCKECGKELIVRPSQYKKQKYFHCEKHIKHHLSGKDSPFYNHINIFCTNCGKQHSVTPYDFNKKNRFGDNHNFCSQQCYWEYRSKYYINNKHHMFGSHQPEDNKQKQRERVVQMISDGIMPQTLSSPHKKINDLLSLHNILFENEYVEKYYAIDIFLSEYNLMIEIMGDYWHANPIKYDDFQLTSKQKDAIRRDKAKHTYIKKYENIEILYLWESDINKNINLCSTLIQEYITNNGLLENYHSFNYHLSGDKLCINDILITPFQSCNNKEIQLAI